MAIYKEAPSGVDPDSVAFKKLGIHMNNAFISANSFLSVGLGEFTEDGMPPPAKGNGRGK